MIHTVRRWGTRATPRSRVALHHAALRCTEPLLDALHAGGLWVLKVISIIASHHSHHHPGARTGWGSAGVLGCLGPGTGLGQCYAVWNGSGYAVCCRKRACCAQRAL